MCSLRFHSGRPHSSAAVHGVRALDLAHRKKIRPSVKRQLVEEAGGKCANPACLNWRTHIHHIEHWAVHENDEPDNLVTVCPTCHDAIHHGALEITDAFISTWKKLERGKKEKIAHLSVEPANELKLLSGSIALSTTNDGLTVFRLSDNVRLRFRALDKDILLVNLELVDSNGVPLVRVVDNHVRSEREDIEFLHVPGHIRVRAPMSALYVPEWVIKSVAKSNPQWAKEAHVTLLDLEVLEPGLIRVQGVWAGENSAVVITESELMFADVARKGAISMVGEGKDSVLAFTGPLTREAFGLR